MSLRWSTDGGHNWSNYYDRDMGQAGQFQTRVRWLRLGSGRDFVFEISYSDAAPLRIIDGYINPEDGNG